MKHFKIVILLSLSIASQACATRLSSGAEPLSSCVAKHVGSVSLRSDDGIALPDLSNLKELNSEDIRKLVRAMPESEKNKIIAVTKSVAADISNAPLQAADYQLLHDRIFREFSDRAANVYRAAECGPKAEVGEQIFVIVTDWIMIPFEGSPLLGTRSPNYDFASVVRTAVVLEINSVQYRYDELVRALR